MQLVEWIPSVTVTGLFAVALWLGRKVIATRLTRSVEHEFNEKLESIRADLRAKETELASLRGGAMSALASRQMEIDRRRLQAVDELWSAVTELGKAKGASALMATVKFEAATKEAERNPQFRAVFEAMGGGLDPKSLDVSGASKARPYVSHLAWAYFSAISAIAMQAVMKLHILKTGLDMPDFIDRDGVKKLVKVALPHQEEYIDKYGEAGYHYLLDELERNLLDELSRMLEGTEADRANLQKAAEIVRLSNQLQRQPQ